MPQQNTIPFNTRAQSRGQRISMLTRAEMVAIIEKHESVSYDGLILSHIHQLPSELELARHNPELQDVAVAELQGLINKHQQELAAFMAAKEAGFPTPIITPSPVASLVDTAALDPQKVEHIDRMIERLKEEREKLTSHPVPVKEPESPTDSGKAAALFAAAPKPGDATPEPEAKPEPAKPAPASPKKP